MFAELSQPYTAFPLFMPSVRDNWIMDLTDEQRSDLRALIRSHASVPERAQLVLWRAEGNSIKAVEQMGRTTRPTVYKWLDRHERLGHGRLVNVPPPGRPREVPDEVRAQIVALTRRPPPEETGLSHWSRMSRRYHWCRFPTGLLEGGEDFGYHVAALLGTFVVLLGQHGGGEADDSGTVGEDVDHVGPSLTSLFSRSFYQPPGDTNLLAAVVRQT